MKALTLRKQLLIAESEVNRRLLATDLELVVAEAKALASEAQALSTLVRSTATAASLIAGLAAAFTPKAQQSVATTPWWQRLLNHTSLVTSLVKLFSARAPRDHSR